MYVFSTDGVDSMWCSGLIDLRVASLSDIPGTGEFKLCKMLSAVDVTFFCKLEVDQSGLKPVSGIPGPDSRLRIQTRGLIRCSA